MTSLKAIKGCGTFQVRILHRILTHVCPFLRGITGRWEIARSGSYAFCRLFPGIGLTSVVDLRGIGTIIGTVRR